MEYIETALTVIGAISAVWFVAKLIVAIFGSSEEWRDDVIIKTEEYNEKIDYEEQVAFSQDRIYPVVYKSDFDDALDVSVTYIIPQGRTLYGVKIKKVTEESIEKGKEKYRLVKRIGVISPITPLCAIVERAEAIPKYSVEWKTQYGGKAIYYFDSNMRTSRHDQPGVIYHYNIVSKIRRFLNI